ncbi:hypothetical protein [Chengkuizengella axinellae]|uniref:Uncharacterized protein n=1 Tax=Chengkuizengella axinellae TaxID=3064388 RepID=A0ABT9J463_9BACL|nr:hypothetical protein [Chengkuizengella sp. 2205SS18-9]MDP5275775.1 hypothetical protein [Chengkuizengella sp. 2205SS18-9]
MYTNINKQIDETQQRHRKHKKLKLKLDQLRLSLQTEKSKLIRYKTILDDEEQDVNKLESFSLGALFYTIVGTKEKKLQKEKQEYLAAKLKYDEAYETVSDISEEVLELVKLVKEYQSSDQDYEKLIKMKKEMILQSKDENTEKLIQLREARSELQEDIRELKEAIQAGNNVKSNLRNMSEALHSAKNWGTYDMLGGGLIATASKHSKIDRANRYAHQVQRSLRLFKNELLDVKVHGNFDLQLSSFDTFADYFFDGLISDWIVQSKINNSLNNVSDMNRKIAGITQKLNIQSELKQNELDAINKSILQFVSEME